MYALPISGDNQNNKISLSTLSVTTSQLGCLRSCAYQHFLRYQLGYRPPHGVAEDYGTLNHCLIKLLHRHWKTEAVNLASDENVHEWLQPLAYEHARLRFARGQIRDGLIQSSCRDVTRYVAVARPHLIYVVDSETPFRFYFSRASLLLEGRIDAVLQLPGEGFIIRDFKSRKEDEGVITHETLAASAFAWECQHGTRVERTEIFNLQTGQIDAHPFDDSIRSQVEEMLNQAAIILRATARERRPTDDDVCRRCDERPMCRPTLPV